MSLIYNYIFGKKEEPIFDKSDVTVSVAESITAGTLSNTLCSEPGASKFFKGGVIAYSINSKKEILGIDIDYAEKNNFANPITTSDMARSVALMFKSRFGISTTGYSLPTYREENKELGLCKLDIKQPYAYICLYDRLLDVEIMVKEEYHYDEDHDQKMQRAYVQVKVALKAQKIYEDYIKNLSNERENPFKPHQINE